MFGGRMFRYIFSIINKIKFYVHLKRNLKKIKKNRDPYIYR